MNVTATDDELDRRVTSGSFYSSEMLLSESLK